MRLWTIHPKYLDRQGLVACWREGLGAQVALSRRKGYSYHPQLERFKRAENPLAKLAGYLSDIEIEAFQRGYSFNRKLLYPGKLKGLKLTVTQGQLEYEINHLLRKLLWERKTKTRWQDAMYIRTLVSRYGIRPHPMFRVIPGPVESWEKVKQTKKE